MDISRWRDPAFRAPLIGVAVSYVLWLATMLLVKQTGLAQETESIRWLAVVVPMLPITLMVFFFLQLSRRGDEVVRAMHGFAATCGFVVMLFLSLLALHLESFDLPLRISPQHIWISGMLAWLIGLGMAMRRYR